MEEEPTPRSAPRAPAAENDPPDRRRISSVAQGGARVPLRRPTVLVFPGELWEEPPVAELIERWELAGRARFEPVFSLEALAQRAQLPGCEAVICDLVHTGHAGLDLLRSLRARARELPFVLLVEPGDREAGQRAHTLGFCLPIPRPTSEAELDVALLRLLSPVAGQAPAPRVRRSAEFAPAMIWKTDAAGLYTNFTKRWLLFTGRPEPKERGIGWFDAVHPDDLGGWRDAYAAALDAQREFSFDLRMRTAKGGYRWVRHQGIPSFGADRKFTGYVGSSYEIHDLKQAQDDALATIDRLRALNRDLEEGAHAVAHDLQEPLRNLEHTLGEAKLGLPMGDREESLDQAKQLVSRMQELVRDLLEYAGVTRRPLSPETVQPAQSVEWALSNLRKLVDETGGRVEIEPLPSVRADPVQLARVFQNLLANALRFHGMAPPRVLVSGESSGAEVQLAVRDNGVGIKPEDHEAIFGIFQRLHGDEVAGTGAGLAICRRVIERHGGRIWVESEPGAGSTFRFTLPAAAPAGDA